MLLEEPPSAPVPMGAAGFYCQYSLIGQSIIEDFHNRVADITIQPDVRLDEDRQPSVVAVVVIISHCSFLSLDGFCYNTIIFERSYRCP